MEPNTRTLYCSGFPLDIRDREVRNCFQFQKGFEWSQLVQGGRVPIVFVTFATHEDAARCKEIMHGGKLDEDSSIELRLEFAKQDREAPRKRSYGNSDTAATGSNKRARATEVADTTIYFYGLNSETREADVRALVAGREGFVRFRWSPSKRPGGTPVAYADFQTHETAKAAMEIMNGTPVESVPNGICVRFADIAPGPTRRGGQHAALPRQAAPYQQHYPSYPAHHVQHAGEPYMYMPPSQQQQMAPPMAGAYDQFSAPFYNPYGSQGPGRI
jgi:hypothetical protein